MSERSARRGLSLSALFSLVALLLACDSELLGPTECERVALALVRVRSRAQLGNEKVRDLVERLTGECLTTPYDRRFRDCVMSGAPYEICLADLYRRHPERREPAR